MGHITGGYEGRHETAEKWSVVKEMDSVRSTENSDYVFLAVCVSDERRGSSVDGSLARLPVRWACVWFPVEMHSINVSGFTGSGMHPPILYVEVGNQITNVKLLKGIYMGEAVGRQGES